MAEKIKYVSLENLDLYDELLKDYITQQESADLKTVALSEDSKKLLFYTVPQPVGDTAAKFEIELPDANLDGVMKKVVSAIEGHIGTFNGSGEIVDSGKALSDLAEKTYVDTKVAEEIGKSQHLKKEIVEKAPEVGEAQENILYMVKDETATGDDKYKEYMLIGGEVVMIGTTSIDLSNYDTKDQVDSKITTAKEGAISEATETASGDATTKANKALEDAKSYTDSKYGDLETKVTTNTEGLESVQDTVQTLNSTVSQQGDRLTAAETKLDNIDTATEEDIRGLFN